MENINFADVILPVEGQEMWDIYLYVIFFFQVIMLFVLFTGSLRDVIFTGIIIMCTVADKTYLFGFVEGGFETIPAAVDWHTTESFLTFVIRVVMFFLPTIIITQTKIKRARPLAILLAIMSLLYASGRWFFQQFPEGQEEAGSLLPYVGIYATVFAQRFMVRR